MQFGSKFPKGGNALLAQMVERKAVNLKVIGSNPIQSDDFLTFITIYLYLIDSYKFMIF